MLKIKNVSKTFNPGTVNEKKALNNINLEVHDGDFITIIGGNGAGKSTLMNMIAGVYPIDCGYIYLADKNISLLKEHQRAQMIGRVFQDPMLGTASDMAIQENLAMANRRGMKRGLRWGITKEEKEVFYKTLQRLGLGLEDRMTVKVGLLSGGQRQALTLLMATLKRPQLLLLDEHTAALDPKSAKKILRITNELIEKEHITALMITHNINDALVNGNRLFIMNDGTLIQDFETERKKQLKPADILNYYEV